MGWCIPYVTVCALSCVRLFETPVDCSPPGSSVHGIFQAILEWVAISYSRRSSWTRDWTHVSGGSLYWQTDSLPLSYLESPHSLHLPHLIAHYYESIDFNTCNKWGSLVAQTVNNLHAMKETSVWSPGKGNGYPFQYPCLENPMDRGAWQATVHGVAKSQMWLGETNNKWGSLNWVGGQMSWEHWWWDEISSSS